MLNRLISPFKPVSFNLTVVVSFDERYLDYGTILLNSISKNSPHSKIIVLAINISRDKLSKFSQYNNIKILHEDKKFAHPYEQRLYTTTRRIFLINEILSDDSVENLLHLDADSIIMKNLNHFSQLFTQGDFLIFARPKMKHEELRLTMNVLGLSNSVPAKALAKEWVNQLWEILREPQTSKYIDQLTLWKAYEKVNTAYDVKLVNLMPPYIGESRKSVIRTFYATKNAKGNRALIKELNKFIDKELVDAPSNAPPKPDNENIYLSRELLLDHFKEIGFHI